MKYTINLTFDDGANGTGYVVTDANGSIAQYDVSTDFGPVVPGVQYCNGCSRSFAGMEGSTIVLRRGNDGTPAFPFSQDYQELRLPLSGGGSEYFVEDRATGILARGVVSGGIESPTPVPVPAVPWAGLAVLGVMLWAAGKKHV